MLPGPGMRSEPEAGDVKQSGLGCEQMFELGYLPSEFCESKTGFTAIGIK